MKYQLTNRQMSSTIGDEVVILNHKEGVYYSLEEVGTFIWEQLQAKPQTIDELVGSVCINYEIDEEECRADIQKLLHDLTLEKLVEKIEA
jgi:Coenzyme PQQ synthesis protein D (PqqD)